MSLLFAPPFYRVTDNLNAPIPGAFVGFYQTQTSTLQPVYSDSGLTTPLLNPVQADGDGNLPAIWLDDALSAYKYVIYAPDITDPTIPGIVIRSGDPYNADINAQGLTQTLFPLFNPLTAGEQLAGVTSPNYAYPAGYVLRYGTNTTPGTTDMTVALQTAINSADVAHPQVNFTDTHRISKPLLIGTSTVENLALIGAGRTVSVIQPSAVSISTPAQGINALIINQINNGHLQLKDCRFHSDVAYTGYALYSTENGCTDGSGQAAFSMHIDNVWVSLSSQNVGIFVGGFSNLKVTNLTVEFSTTGVFILQGVGNGDLLFDNITVDESYDAFLLGSDSNLKALISVSNLSVYEHQRGRVIEINNGQTLKFNNIALEVDPANVGNTGLFKFTDCQNVECSNFSMATRTTGGVATGAVGIELINGFSGKFLNGVINAVTGLSMSGTGSIVAEFVNVDFTNCTTCWTVSGTLTGVLKFVNCKMNNAQQNCIVQTAGTMSFDVEFIGGEVLNAGLNGTTGFSNLNISPAGTWIFRNTVFGANNVGAVAANWVNATAGGGSITFETPKLVGSPPTALNTGTLGVFWNYPKGLATLPSAATLTLPYAGDIFTITGTTGITSIGVAGNVGRRIVLSFQGAVTVTNGSTLKLAGATNFISTADDTLSLYCDGTAWRETGRAVN